MLYYNNLNSLKHEKYVNNPFYVRWDTNKTNRYEREDKCMCTNKNTLKTQITQNIKIEYDSIMLIDWPGFSYFLSSLHEKLDTTGNGSHIFSSEPWTKTGY